LELFAELERNKEKDCNYLLNETICKIRKKESINHIYLDTSLITTPISDEQQYCSRNVATLGATNFTSSTSGYYKLGGDSVVYIVDAMVYSCYFYTGVIDH